MFAPGGEAIHFTFSIALIFIVGYSSGRIHQYVRRNTERRPAHREGYDEASQSLFPLTVRSGRPGPTSRS